MAPPKQAKTGYVNNKEFWELLKKYKENPEDRKTYNELGKIFMLIAKNFMNKSWFINYTDDRKQEMISESVYTSVKYMHNFDPSRNSSPFAYFTQICYNAFVRISKKYMLQAERYCSLDYVEGGDGYARMVDEGNAHLLQNQTNSRNAKD